MNSTSVLCFFHHVNSDYHLGSLGYNLKNFFSISCNADLLATNSIFIDLGQSFIHFFFFFLIDLLNIGSWLTVVFFLWALWICHPTALFLLRSQLLILLGFSCKWCHFSVSTLKILFLSLTFNIFTVMYLLMNLWIYPTWSLLSLLNVYIIVFQ